MRTLRQLPFRKDQRGAVAPLFALSLMALVALGGVGFDYGRLAAMDSELQNAADQAALAAATQLDGRADAITRARDAANDFFASSASEFVNETRFANDGAGRPITSLSFRFYQTYEGDTPSDEITDDDEGASAHVVEVTVNGREVFYALTPIVGALSSGDIVATAMAGVEGATCNVPPLMFCAPNKDFPTEADIGKGLKLHMLPNATDAFAPGNFSFLDIDYGTTGNPNRRLGLNSALAGCFADAIESDPGVRSPEEDALNTRFDIYPSGLSCDTATGNYCPAESVRKNFTVTETKSIRVRIADPVPAAPSCGTYDTRSGWTANAAANNFPQDDCFLNGTCSVVGDGDWGITSYLNAHHPGMTSADFPSGTRWEIYNWEKEDAAGRLAAERLSTSYTTRDQGINRTYTFTNVCSYARPLDTSNAVVTSETQKDRRLLTVASVDCTGLHGRDTVNILRWVDLFLVTPVQQNGSEKEFFTEIVGPAKRANGKSGFQYFGRKKVVLIR